MAYDDSVEHFLCGLQLMQDHWCRVGMMPMQLYESRLY